MNEAKSIGRSVARKEALPKVTGSARYVDDVAMPGMIHGVTVRSACARGRITGVRFLPGIPWDEIAVVTARDIPGENVVALINDDQPCLADGVINHPEEPVLLLAHPIAPCSSARGLPSPSTWSRCRRCSPIEDALAPKAVVWGKDNVFKEYSIDKGDVDAALARADVVVEGEYETRRARAALHRAERDDRRAADAKGGVTVWGSMQCPYYIQKALMKLFGQCRRRGRASCSSRPAAGSAARRSIRR